MYKILGTPGTEIDEEELNSVYSPIQMLTKFEIPFEDEFELKEEYSEMKNLTKKLLDSDESYLNTIGIQLVWL